MLEREDRDRHTSNEHAVSKNGLLAAFDGVPLGRREVLATVGAVVATPAVASREASATDHGYGAGAYGGGPYGDPVDDGSGVDPILTVQTHDATGVDGTSATLNGDLTELQGYADATVYFEWGRTGDLSNATDQQTLASTGGFDDELTGLESGVEYAFRAVAEADGDADTGGTLTFTTESVEEAPTADPEVVLLRVEDTSNPRNPHADVSIEWGARIDEGQLDSAGLTVSDSAGEVLSRRYDLCGQSVERSESERIHHGGGETYAVELTVRSGHGTIDCEHTTLDSP